MHNPQCGCAECCTARQRSTGMATAPPPCDHYACPPDMLSSSGHYACPIPLDQSEIDAKIEARGLVCGSMPAFAPPAGAVADDSFPWSGIGAIVVGAIVIKEGTTRALLVYDSIEMRMLIVYWERNAATSGIGEWAVIPEDQWMT